LDAHSIYTKQTRQIELYIDQEHFLRIFHIKMDINIIIPLIINFIFQET
jgi:hypothetical protein